MKARYIIMIIVLVVVATIMINLKENKGTRTLSCSINTEFQELDSVINLDIAVKNKEVRGIDIVIDAKVPDEYKNQKQNMIDSINTSGKMQATSTKEGIRFKTDINSEYFKSLKLNMTSSYSELKAALEFEGYTCK